MKAARLLVCAIAVGASACGTKASAREERPAAAIPAAASSEAPSKLLVVLPQRDDRDLATAASFVTAHRTVVLLTFRQPNRHHQAGQVLLLDTHDEIVSTRLLPARGSGEDPTSPALRYLDDPSDRTDGLVLDLVPEIDPLGGAMVGNVHTLGRGSGLVTKAMPKPPRGARWAGPTLAWATDGELAVLVRSDRGERVFAPFGPGATELRDPRDDEKTPRVATPGPSITSETRCDDGGCHTSVRLALGDRRRAALQGKGSGSLQQRTPVE